MWITNTYNIQNIQIVVNILTLYHIEVDSRKILILSF